MNSFSKRLRELRIEKNLTQEELATLFGLQKSTISQYELSKRQADDDLKRKLAEFFNVSIDYLMGVTDVKESADKILKDSESLAFHRTDDFYKDLPP
ncbi:helix-turn-helix domain-containing protein, partial [Clostridium sp.]|uniref:helix-turn-helix domain-containing protein n=1 Tax=Clostridium sp. TaxID=1506 RepID=UPI003464D80A